MVKRRVQFNIETGDWWSLAELSEEEQRLLSFVGRLFVDYFDQDDVDMDEAMEFADTLYKKFNLDFDKLDKHEYETHLRTFTFVDKYE